MTDEEIHKLGKVPVISRTFAVEKRATINPQVFLLDLTIETEIPGDVMLPLIYGKHIVSVQHHYGLLLNRVDDGLDEEIDGMAADFAMRL